MNKTLAILGAGELGKQIANFAICDYHYTHVLFYDDISKEEHVVGTSETLLSDYQKNRFDELLIGIGYNHLVVRKQKFDFFRNAIPFGKIIHSTAWVDKSAEIAEGCVLYPRCVIDKNVRINSNTILNLNCTIAHDTKVGAHNFLAPSVVIAGFCTVGELCFLGTNTTVSDSISITDKTKTGAATVVTKDIKESGLYVGCPSKKIK